MVVRNVRTTLEFTGRHDIQIDNWEVITKHEWRILPIDHLYRDATIAWCITKFNNLVSTTVRGGVFTTICGSFDARLCFGVPLYRGLLQKMDDSSLVSPCSKVRHEVSIKKTGDQNWFSHRRGTWVWKLFRIYRIQVSPIPFNSIKVVIVRCLCIELDGGWGIFI